MDPLLPPLKGVSENLSYGIQEQATTRDAKNARSLNPRDGRVMISQRAGLTNYSSNQVNADNKVQDLSVLGYDTRNVLWSGLENEVSQPEAFDDAYWTTVNGLTVQTNHRTAPDGRMTADRLVDPGAGLGAIYRDFTPASFDWLTNGAAAFFSLHTRLSTSSTNDTRGLITLFHLGTNEKSHQVRILGTSNPPTLEFRSNSTDSWRAVETNDPVLFEGEEEGYFRLGVGNTLDTTLSNTLRAEFQPISTTPADTGTAWAWGAQFEQGTNAGPYTHRNSAVLPSKANAVNVQTDIYGNVYVLDATANITKFSADLKQIWTIPLPLTDPKHVVRALHIGRFGGVYTGVAEGGDMTKATIWRYQQLPENTYELTWTLSPGMYCEEIKTYEDKAYFLLNNPSWWRSFIHVYDRLVSQKPRLLWKTADTPCAYPAKCMSLNSRGDALVGSPETPSQLDPAVAISTYRVRDTESGQVANRLDYGTAVSIKPLDLVADDLDTNSTFKPNVKLWAHYRAEDIISNDLLSNEYRDGAVLSQWRDLTGNGRHLSVHSAAAAGPSLRLNGPGRRPTLVFDGSNALVSGKNTTIERTEVDQQRTVLPGYTDCQFTVAILCRPSIASNQGTIISQANSDASGLAFAVVANRTNSVTITNTVPGRISVYDDTSSNGAAFQATASNQPASGSLDNGYGFARIVYHNNGAVNPTAAADAGSNYSLFNLNGDRLEDSYFSHAFTTLDAATEIGYSSVTNFGWYRGEISEIVVYAAVPDTNANEDAYPFKDTTPPTSESAWTANHPDALLDGYMAYQYGTYWDSARVDVCSRSNNGFTEDNNYKAVAFRHPVLAKFGADNGTLLWSVSALHNLGVRGGLDGTNVGGVGYGVVVDPKDNVLSIGPKDIGVTSNVVSGNSNGLISVRKIIDEGESPSMLETNGAWTVSWGTNEFPEYTTPRLATDHSNNLYTPVFNATLGNAVRIYSGTDATLLNGFPLPDGNPDSFAVAIDPYVPDYADDLSPERAPNVYLTTDNMEDETIEVIHKIPIVKKTQLALPARTYKLIAVAGNIVQDVSNPATFSVPTRGVGLASFRATYIQSANLFEKMYFVSGDGVPQFYDPLEDEVVVLKASVGFVPDGARLVETWRGRLVLGRTHDEPQNWFMSRRDDPTDWDFVPFQPEETQAVAGNQAEAGLFPDILNTLIPYSDDILIFGGDRSIYQMSGDPAAGGRFDLLTDKTGMSFGRPWTKDPQGILYFYGSRGGLYRMVPGGVAERLSVNRIERRLQDIDLSTYYVRLEYNWRDEGVHVVFCPYGSGGSSIEHWFYCIKTDSFWPDFYGDSSTTDPQPTSMVVLDGDDPADRVLLFGCEDGRIRKWNKDAKSDGLTGADATIPIDSYCMYELPMKTGFEVAHTGLHAVLDEYENGCSWEIFAGEEPRFIGPVKANGWLLPGRNRPVMRRTRGAWSRLRLRNASAEQRWAVEEILIASQVAGRARARHGTS